MLKTTVTCWFCNKESTVFLLNKNSWTCKHCDQYNGFKKDGDYNKKIPEMESDGEDSSKRHYCTTSTNGPVPTTNLLCDKCNRNQELKLADLNKFEPKNEDNFEEEYRIYKLKMDQIYGLCHPCTQRLNSHLKNQDLQIGGYVVKNRRSSILPNGSNGPVNGGKLLTGTLGKHAATNGKNGSANMATTVMSVQSTTTTITASSIVNSGKEVRNRASLQPSNVRQSQVLKNSTKINDSLVSLDNSINTSGCINGSKPKFLQEDLSSSKGGSPSQDFFKKAYTIAGTVPSMMLRQTKQALNNISINASQAQSFLDENYFEFEEEDAAAKLGTTYTLGSGAKTATATSNGGGHLPKPERKIKVTFNSIMTILIDLVILGLINLMFACDLVNLCNDSGVLVIVSPLGGVDEDSDYPYLQTLLSIYKYKVWIFALMVGLSMRLAYKRPRVSRFVALLSFVLGLAVHADMFASHAEEQCIFEVIVSFFLAAYLVMARAYNLVQCVRSF